MKKFASVLSLVMFSSLMIACSSGPIKVSYVEIDVSDVKPGVPDSSTAHLVLKPDYAKKTIAVSYARNKNDAVINGTLGAENFDRFQKVVGLVKSYDQKKADNSKVGTAAFYIKMVDLSGKSFDIKAEDSNADKTLEELRSFYFDIGRLLTEDEQV